MSRGSNTPVSVGEQAEHHAHEKAFQIVSPVSGVGERVVQSPDQFGGLDVRRVLIAEGPALHAEDEPEGPDMRGQIRQRALDDRPLVEIAKLEGLEVAHQNEARAVALAQRVESTPRLARRLCRGRARRSSARQ